MIVAEEGQAVFHCRENCSMLHYMEGKKLSARGMEKLTGILTSLKDECRSLDVAGIYLISTAAMRAVDNFSEVEKCVRRETGLAINLIDGKTEAYCDYVANRALLDGETVLVDIGGSSVELCDGAKSDREEMLSLNIGPIRLNKKFVSSIHPDEEEAKEIKAYVKEKLKRAGVTEKSFRKAVLVGPMSLAIYEVYADYFKADLHAPVKKIEYLSLKKLTKFLVGHASRSMLILKNSPERFHTLTTAAVLLRTLLKRFEVTEIVVSDRGVKEGYLACIANGEVQGICSSAEAVVKPVKDKKKNASEKKKSGEQPPAAEESPKELENPTEEVQA